jgi:hypothetical protein
MKKHLPLSFLLGTALSFNLGSYGQADQFVYAVTDINNQGANWGHLRRLDLNSGKFSDVLLNGTDVNQRSYDHTTKQQFREPLKDARFGILANAPFGTGVAAIAYDKKNQRIYYTPMFINQLRYIDLRTMKAFFVSTPGIDALEIKAADQSNIITRMVIADDSYGYALTNDGQHLLQFTTGKNIMINDLGAVVDDPQNKEISIRNACSSYGGDMIADDEGNLLIFSNRTHVFKINIRTKMATHLGTVQGLPTTFTINGAAVDNHNQVIVTSSADHQSIYTVNPKDLTATPVQSDNSWKTADLANSNILATRKSTPYVRLLPAQHEPGDKSVEVFPNPVINDRFTVQFNLNEGTYTIQVKDGTGRLVSTSTTRVIGQKQATTIQLPGRAARGFYLVNVLGQGKETLYSKKILVH